MYWWQCGVTCLCKPNECLFTPKEKHMVSKTYANYEPKSKSSEMCKDCTMFRPPRQCSYVDGRIEPEGWCQFFEPNKEAA